MMVPIHSPPDSLVTFPLYRGRREQPLPCTTPRLTNRRLVAQGRSSRTTEVYTDEKPTKARLNDQEP